MNFNLSYRTLGCLFEIVFMEEGEILKNLKQTKKARRKRRSLKKNKQQTETAVASSAAAQSGRTPDLIATDHKHGIVTGDDHLSTKNGNPSKSSMNACGEIDAEAKDAAAVKVSSSTKNQKNSAHDRGSDRMSFYASTYGCD